MSEDVNERLREKAMTIASLNQKMEALQAQLSGSQRRANELGTKLVELESLLTQKDSEIQMLQSQLSSTKGALDTVGKEMQGIKAEQTQLLAKKKPESVDSSLKDELTLTEMTIGRLREDLKQFSKAATAVINQEEGAVESLKEVLREVGDPKYRILNMVLAKKSIRVEEIASSLVIDMAESREYVDALQAAGEIQIRDGNTILPAKKYLELKVPKDAWLSLEPTDIFQELEFFIGRTDDTASIVEAIETAVEIIEQKLARSGALIFQMRRTADAWKKHAGNVEELQYTIKDWKGRAQALR
jgi:myosin heavy subunit